MQMCLFLYIYLLDSVRIWDEWISVMFKLLKFYIQKTPQQFLSREGAELISIIHRSCCEQLLYNYSTFYWRNGWEDWV